MCLTTSALAVFLNLIGAEIVSTSPDRITVHATSTDAHWIASGDRWCTMAPELDRIARFSVSRRG